MNDVIAIRDYIAQFSPNASQRIAQRLIAAGESLSRSPDRGRAISNGARELVVIYPYLLRYRVSDQIVSIIRVRHGARRPD